MDWILKHFKIVIVMISTIVTGIILPLTYWWFGVILDLRESQANDHKQDDRILRLESVTYKMDGRFELIQKSLQVIQDREFKELLEARASRLKK